MRRLPLTSAPDRLDPLQRGRILRWATERWPRIGPLLGRHWGECRDWHLANGVLRADWEAAFRNWLRKAADFAERREGRPGSPSVRRTHAVGQPRDRREPSMLGAEVVRLFPGGRDDGVDPDPAA